MPLPPRALSRAFTFRKTNGRVARGRSDDPVSDVAHVTNAYADGLICYVFRQHRTLPSTPIETSNS
ncbi:hypothetical protein EA472_10470 [Natrarchaeobius oligotrophus]|uniref:Uncharacterized protein n=1 Tax=Natrarchaeobius chitinivorans TaxID=1679083 RepID=A0A3N6MVD3_NATCH|nr:hypothetical protein EA472_10470 [Natrarchaeobius chitinivorans]